MTLVGTAEVTATLNTEKVLDELDDLTTKATSTLAEGFTEAGDEAGQALSEGIRVGAGEAAESLAPLRGALDEVAVGSGMVADVTSAMSIQQANAAARALALADAQRELDAANAGVIATQTDITSGDLDGAAASSALSDSLGRQTAAQRLVNKATKENALAQDALTGSTDEAALAQGRLADKELESGEAAEKSSGGVKKLLSGIGIPDALLGGWGELAAGIGIAAAAGIDLESHFQSATTAIANAEGITTKAAKNIGDAMLATGGQVEYSADEQAEAFSQVAGQMRSAEGSALGVKQTMQFMGASMDLAAASGTSLGTATSSLAGIMQAFQIKTKDAADTANILFNTANATGQGVDTLSAALEKVKTKLGVMAPPLSQMAGLLVDMTNHGETGRAAMSALSTAFTTLLKPAADAKAATNALKIATDNLPSSLRGLATEYENGKINGTDLYKVTENLSASQGALFDAFKKAADAAQTSNVAAQTLGITVTNSKGNFVGLTSVIDQLHEKTLGMSKAQTVAELTALGFGSSAAKLAPVVIAGSAALTKATAAATKHNAVEQAAAREAHTLAGYMWHIVSAAALDIGVKIGEFVLPPLEKMLTVGLTVVKWAIDFGSWMAKLKFPLIILGGIMINLLLPAMATMVDSMVEFVEGIPEAIAGILGFGEAAETAGAESATAFGPIGLIIAAIGIAVYEVIDHWSAIADFFEGLWHDVVDLFKRYWKIALEIILGPIGIIIVHWHAIEDFFTGLFRDVVDFIKKHWELIVEILTGPIGIVLTHWKEFRQDISAVFDEVRHDIAHYWDDIVNDATETYETVLHFFEQLPVKILHAIESGASKVLKAFEKYIPGGGLIGSALNVIGLAKGGVVHSPTLAVIGEKGSEAVVPLDQFGRLGGGENVQPTASIGASQSSSTTSITHEGVNVYITQPNMTAAQLENEFNWLYRTGKLTGAAQ